MVARRIVLIGLPLQDVIIHQLSQSLTQYIGSDAQLFMKFIMLLNAKKGGNEYEQIPTIPNQIAHRGQSQILRHATVAALALTAQ